MARILINSIPKSGTYRVSALLQAAGIAATGIHITDDKVWNYSGQDLQSGRTDPDAAFQPDINPSRALESLDDNQLLVGHFGFSIQHTLLLEQHTQLFLVRDLREVIVSWCRWQVFSGQSQRLADIESPQQRVIQFMQLSAKPAARMILSLLPWFLYLPKDHVFRVDELQSSEHLQRLFSICGLQHGETTIAAIRQQIEKQDTLTKVPGKTLVSEHWSEPAEELFHEVNLHTANAILGFTTDPEL